MIQVAEGIQNVFETATNSMKSFEALAVPYKQLHNAIAELESHCGNISRESGILIGEIKTLALSATTNLGIYTDTIDAWCEQASDLLQVYVNLGHESFFTRFIWKSVDYDADVAKAQRETLTKVLGNGMEEMGRALEIFGKSITSFNQASGKLATLKHLISGENSLWNKLLIIFQGIMITLPAIAAVGTGLPMGLLALIAAGNVEAVRRRIVNLSIEFANLGKNIESSQIVIANITALCRDEMEVVRTLKGNTDTVDHLLKNRACHNEAIIAAKKLILLCKSYRDHKKQLVKYNI